MGRPPKDTKREITVTIKLTQIEFEKLELDRKSHDYNSRARYIRDTLFGRKTAIKKIPYSGRAIRDGINAFTVQVSKFGVLYNQKIKRINSLIDKKRSNGDQVINTQYLSRIEDQSTTLMEGVVDTQHRLIDFVREALARVEGKISQVLAAVDIIENKYGTILSSKGRVRIGDKGYIVSVEGLINSSPESSKASVELRAELANVKKITKEFDNK